jgi:dTDP-4-amino-4,6-dideoxygalactose transaminase
VLKLLEPCVPEPWEYAVDLRAIHERRWFTNAGPVVGELEAALGTLAGHGTCISSCTAGLELAARKVFAGLRTVLTPAFSFPATPQALLAAGLDPVFCDGYELTPDRARRLVAEHPEIDAVMPVCAFGKRQPGWEGFPLPVVIDAASAIGNHETSVPSVYSLHATKCLPAIEGGYVAGVDLGAEVCFGFDPARRADRISSVRGTNAKLSEMHAAIGLASFRNFRRNTQKRIALENAYREHLPDDVVAPERPVGSYNVFPVFVEDAADSMRLLAEHGIQSLRWQVPTLEKHPAFSGCRVIEPLTECARLERQLLCLPFHIHMTIDDARRVCRALEVAEVLAA